MAMPGRPRGVTLLAVFCGASAVIAAASATSLAFPGSVLEPMWRANPRAHEGFNSLGIWAPSLLVMLSAVCVATAVGLWRGARWGYLLAVTGLAVNIVGDSVNAVLGAEPRAALGIPIVLVLLWYLARPHVRAFVVARSSGRRTP